MTRDHTDERAGRVPAAPPASLLIDRYASAALRLFNVHKHL